MFVCVHRERERGKGRAPVLNGDSAVSVCHLCWAHKPLHDVQTCWHCTACKQPSGLLVRLCLPREYNYQPLPMNTEKVISYLLGIVVAALWESSGGERTPCGKEIEGKYAWNSLEFLVSGPISAPWLVRCYSPEGHLLRREREKERG